MNSYLYIQISDINKYNVILKLNKINVKIYDLKENDNNVIIKILASDYEKITKYLKTLKVKKLKYTNYLYLKYTFKKYYLVLLALLCSVLLVISSSFFIVDIKVLHNDDELVKLILTELEENGVKKFHLAKSYNELTKIKNKIRDNNLDKIDWLEITKVGMKYIVRVEERIITPKETVKDYCHVYATKDGIIKSIKLEKGQMQVDLEDYVQKGDILINGDIHLNEETVNHVCAQGKVYAEVWYTVNVKVPLKYTEKEKTGKVRNNFIINYDGIDHVLFKDRLTSYTSQKKELFNLLGVKFYLRKDEEISEKELKYTTSEALEKALNEALEKVNLTLDNDEKIISKNVLQKTINDSTIDVDIFIVTEENIADQKEAIIDGKRIT